MATTPKSSAAKNGTARKPPAKVSRAAAQKAIADLKDKPKTSSFRGIELTLPAKMPAAFAFDIAEVEEALQEGGMGALNRLMAGFIGPEQWRTVRRKITEDNQSIEDLGSIVTELLDTVVGPYGIDVGKSGASAAS